MSGKVISVQSSYLNSSGYALTQCTYTGADTQLWSFEETASGSYVLRPKSAESYTTDWCMCAGDQFLTIVEGLNVEQKAYTNDSNYKDEWILIPLQDYTFGFYGVDAEEGHDHVTGLELAQESLNLAGYNHVEIHSGTFLVSDVLDDLTQIQVFTSRSHGGYVLYTDSTTVANTFICLDNDTNAFLHSHTYTSMNSYSDYLDSTEDFSNINIAIFAGCHTGEGGVGARNLPTAIVNYGATVAIGFEGEIGCAYSNIWVDTFFYYFACCENSVEDAVSEANLASGISSTIVCGDATFVLP